MVFIYIKLLREKKLIEPFFIYIDRMQRLKKNVIFLKCFLLIKILRLKIIKIIFYIDSECRNYIAYVRF